MRCQRTLAAGDGVERWFWCSGPRALAPAPPEVPTWSGASRYALCGVLGRGGAGTVYLATHREHGASVAIKMLSASAARNPRTRQRFLREIEVASGLDEPGVVRVLDGEADGDGTAWFAMEWVRGPTLRAVLTDGPLPMEEALRIGRAVAGTLARLHAQGLAHRDVKPSNLLLSRRGAPKLADFGLVAVVEEEEARRLTTHAVGTPAYMAPEQVADPLGAHDGRVIDQFALALVIEECITGRLIDRSALEGSWVAERYPALGAVLAKAHHPDPYARYGSMRAFADDLDRVAHGERVRARPPGAVYHLRRAARRHRSLWIGAAGAALAVAVGSAGWSAWTGWRGEAEAMQRLEAMEARAGVLRASGRDAEARALFEAFVALPENQGRDALAHAWLAQGRRDREGPTFTAAIDSLSRAFVAAVDGSTRETVAAVLEEVLRASGRYRAAHALRRAFPASMDAVDDLRWAMEAGDAQAMLSALPAADRRRVLWSRLQRGTPLPARVKRTGDLDGDGLADDMFLEAPHPLGMPLQGLPVRDIMEERLSPFHGTRYWLRTTPDGGIVERTEAGAFELRCPFDGSGQIPGTVGADGALWTLVQGHGRQVLRVDPTSCALDRPFPMLEALSSYPLSMDLADLDGDGVEEAVVAMGPPEAHGLWVMGQADGAWQALGDLRLGYLPSVRVLDTAHGPRIVATSAHFHPNPTLFPEPPHLGAEAGLHVLRWTGEALVPVDSLRSRPIRDTRGHQWVTTWVGPVDDDGFDDVVTSDGYVYLSTDAPEAPFERVPVGHDALDFVVDIDGDGRLELGATLEERTFLLGVGDPLPTPEARTVEDVGEAALDGARALERVGLERYAAEAYARIGLGRTDASATDALERAASMLADDDPERAAASAEEAAARGRSAMGVVAIERYLDALRPDSAWRVLQEHGDRFPEADRERLERWVAAMRQRTSLSEPPTQARWNERVTWGDGALVVRTVLGAGPLLRVPLRQTGEVVGLHAVFETDAMEFASELDLHLWNGDGQRLTVQLVQRERGGVLYRFVGGTGWGEEVEVPGWTAPSRFEVRMQELPGSPWVAVELWADGQRLQRRRVPRNRGTREAWTLGLDAPAVAGLHGQMATVRIPRLDVSGLVPDDRVVSEPLASWASLAEQVGDPQGRALAHARLRQDPTRFAEWVPLLGAPTTHALAAEAFGGLGGDAVALLPLVAPLDPVALAAGSPELASIRAELLCRVGRRERGLEGLQALPEGPRCRSGGARHGACGPLPPGFCPEGDPTSP